MAPNITISPNFGNVNKGIPENFTISLDSPAPSGGLVVNYNTTGTTANNADYTLVGGTNLTLDTTNHTFTIAAGAQSATLIVGTTPSYTVSNPNETVSVNLTPSSTYYNVFSSTNYSLNGGSSPRGIAVGNFNGDGQSIITANYNSNTISVLLNMGNNCFCSATNITVGSNPTGVAVGDFNGDGNLDLAVANYGSQSISVLQGNGNGGFTNYGTIDLSAYFGAYPFAIAAAPLKTGDTLSSIVTVNPSDNSIAVVVNNTAGALFSAANLSTTPVGTGAELQAGQSYDPVALVLGDFNGDSNIDVATANDGANSVSVLLGDGNGNFTTPTTTLAVGSHPDAIADGELENSINNPNSNSYLDLVTANQGDNTVSVLLNTDGKGDFASAATYTVGADPVAVAIGDFTGNGIEDIATLSGTDNSVSILFGNGEGGFSPATTYATNVTPNGNNAGYLATINLNGQSDSIAFTAPDNNSLTVNSLPGISYNVFTTTSYSIGSGSSPRGVAVNNFNGDGQSLVTANYNSNTISVLLNNGSGGFTSTTYTVGSGPTGVAVGDFNGDGNQDLAVANYGSQSISVLQGNGNGGFTNYGTIDLSAYFGAYPFAIAAAPLKTGDTLSSIVTVNPSDNSIAVVVNNTAGALFSAANLSTTPVGTGAELQAGQSYDPVALVLGDFNGDGNIDVATANDGANSVSVLLGDGTGNFTPPTTTLAVGSHPDAIASGELENSNSYWDLVTANQGDNTVSVLLNGGTDNFATAATYAVGLDPVAVAIGDFNGDGSEDIATLSGNDNSVSILFGNGAGGFSPATTYATNVTPNGNNTGYLATINLNGQSDSIAFTSPDNNSLNILANTNTGNLSLLNLAPVVTVPVKQTVDFNTTSTISGISITADSTEQLTLQLSAANGDLTFGSTSGLNSISGVGSGSVTLVGTLSNLNQALGTLAYTSTTKYQGLDSTDNINLIVSEPAGNLDSSNPLQGQANIPINVINPAFHNSSNNTLDQAPSNNFNSLLFNLDSNTQNLSEVGVFAVNNDSGSITTANGTTLLPGQPGYVEAALSQAQILYGFDPTSLRSSSYNPTSQYTPTSNYLGFYYISNSTSGQVLSTLNPNQATANNVFFNFSAGNSDGLNHLQITSTGTNQFQLAWNGTGSTSQTLLTATPGSGGQPTVEPIIKVTSGTFTTSIVATSDALFNDFVGFYPVLNSSGQITYNGKTLNPGDPGYAAAAVAEIISGLTFNKNTGSVDTNIAPVFNSADQPWQSSQTVGFTQGASGSASGLFAPVLIANGTPSQFESQNPNNNPPSGLDTSSVGANPLAYFAYVSANPSGDTIDHIRSLPGTLAFKDYYQGGDLDYNDIVLHFSTNPTSVAAI